MEEFLNELVKFIAKRSYYNEAMFKEYGGERSWFGRYDEDGFILSEIHYLKAKYLDKAQE